MRPQGHYLIMYENSFQQSYSCFYTHAAFVDCLLGKAAEHVLYMVMWISSIVLLHASHFVFCLFILHFFKPIPVSKWSYFS